MIEGATGQCFPVICPILDRIVRKQDYSGCLKFPRRLDFLYVIRGIVHHTIDPNTSQSPPARRRFHSLLDLAYELPGTCGIRHRHYEVHGTFWSLQLRDPHRLPPLHVAPPIGVFVCTARVYPMQQMSARRRQPPAASTTSAWPVDRLSRTSHVAAFLQQTMDYVAAHITSKHRPIHCPIP